MKILRNSTDLAAWRDARTFGPVVFVPTMGALHDGHLSLIREARALTGERGAVVVSVFVNPTQFGPGEDLAAYPRPFEEDCRLCRETGADAVYTPSTDDMYPPDSTVSVHEGLLSTHLCGASRPGHFDGVCTVVLKLFHRVRPTDAVFGKKDAQQLAIVRQMVRDLDVPVKIHAVETLREPDGLALSSRNRYLTPEERAQAPALRRALLLALLLFKAGERSSHVLIDAATAALREDAPLGRIDYLSLVDAASLRPIETIESPALLAAAFFLGKARLIDNIDLHP